AGFRGSGTPHPIAHAAIAANPFVFTNTSSPASDLDETPIFHSRIAQLASSMPLIRIAIVLCWFGTLSGHGSSARADSSDSSEESSPRRELAGYIFFPSLVVNNPFLSTYFAVSTAAGYEWIRGPDFDALGNLDAVGNLSTTPTRSYRAAAMAQGATFQASLT